MSFKNDILKSHNNYRQDHGAPAMRWSSKLQSNAENWAKDLAKKGYLQHAKQTEEGENIACLKGAELTGAKATEMWYEEVKDYNFKKPGFNSSTGHFTQVVWVNSVELGVGHATASNGMQFVVARYFPAGNMLRRFPENVLPSGSTSSGNQGGNKPDANINNNTNNNGSNNNRNNNNTNNTSSNNKRSITKPPVTRKSSTKDFNNNIVRSHNIFRKRHGSPPLKWDSKLAKSAQEAADEAASTNTLRSVDMNNVGQNMAAMTGGELTGDRVTTMWYDEEKKYDYSNGGFSSSTGSFTQLVWKGTTDIGVGRSFGPQGQTFVIALYSSPGNIRGKYDANVGRPTGPVPTIAPDNKEEACCIIM